MFTEIIRDHEELDVRGLPGSPVYKDVEEAEGDMMRARPDWPDGISVGNHEWLVTETGTIAWLPEAATGMTVPRVPAEWSSAHQIIRVDRAGRVPPANRQVNPRSPGRGRGRERRGRKLAAQRSETREF